MVPSRGPKKEFMDSENGILDFPVLDSVEGGEVATLGPIRRCQCLLGIPMFSLA